MLTSWNGSRFYESSLSKQQPYTKSGSIYAIHHNYAKSEVSNIMKPKKKRPIVDGNADKPIPDVYLVLDTDLARDNLENDLSDADLQDL